MREALSVSQTGMFSLFWADCLSGLKQRSDFFLLELSFSNDRICDSRRSLIGVFFMLLQCRPFALPVVYLSAMLLTIIVRDCSCFVWQYYYYFGKFTGGANAQIDGQYSGGTKLQYAHSCQEVLNGAWLLVQSNRFNVGLEFLLAVKDHNKLWIGLETSKKRRRIEIHCTAVGLMIWNTFLIYFFLMYAV